MKRFTTDFLCGSSSFLAGMGSVLNIRGHHHQYNESDNPDEIALSHDWQMVGQDIRDALKKADAEFCARSPRK
jgi:hypothetical protein